VSRKFRINRNFDTAVGTVALLLAGSLWAADEKNGFDVSDAVVPADEIIWGGVPRDGIPPIHNPKFLDADDADFVRDRDRVLGVFRNGFAKAYPIRIMERHEVVNDTFGDETIVVTYCPLCFSGMAFTVQNEHFDLKFGVSGLLFNSDVLLYDYQTGSLWSQIRSQAISGPLKSILIPAIPAAHTTWRDWKNRYPDTQVLSTDTGFGFRYRSSPYREYERSRDLMFPVRNRSRDYRNKERVLGIKFGNVQKAYPFKELRKYDMTTFSDSIGGNTVTIEWFEDDDYARVIDDDGEEIATVIVYWFAWYAFHPETEVFVAESG